MRRRCKLRAIEIIDVSKTYPRTSAPAVSNLTLRVQEGTLTSLLGPSGCGKTTILRMIAGFERPDQGEILLAGQTVCAPGIWVPPHERGIGMVFQDYALFPHLNVADNVKFGVKTKQKLERVHELLDLVNLSEFAHRFPHELSGGQQQRVALARALAPDPTVVLLDEPFSSLDASLKQQMRTDLRRIIKQCGATAILVTHDQKDALAISDQIVVLNAGQIQQQGTPQEIYALPKNSFVATFVGQSNLLQGELTADGAAVMTDIGRLPLAKRATNPSQKQVLVAIRPHDFCLATDGTIIGKISRLAYSGETIEAVVTTASPGEGTQLLVQLSANTQVSEGDRIQLTIRQSGIHLLSA